MPFNNEFDKKKKKADQRAQGGAGSQSIQRGDASVYRGVKLTEPQTLGKRATDDVLYGFPSQTDPQYKEKLQAFRRGQEIAPSPGIVAENPVVSPTPSLTGAVLPGSYSAKRAGEDIYGQIYKTTPRSEEDIKRLGTAVYSRTPGDLADIPDQRAYTTATAPSVSIGTPREPTPEAETAPTLGARQPAPVGGKTTAQRYAEGDVFSAGDVGNTYRRLSNERNRLRIERNAGRLTDRMYEAGMKRLGEEEANLRGMAIQEAGTQAKLGAERAGIERAKIQQQTELLKLGTLSEDQRARLEADIFKSKQAAAIELRKLTQTSNKAAQAHRSIFEKALSEGQTAEQASEIADNYLIDNAALFTQEEEADILRKREAQLGRLLETPQ